MPKAKVGTRGITEKQLEYLASIRISKGWDEIYDICGLDFCILDRTSNFFNSEAQANIFVEDFLL